MSIVPIFLEIIIIIQAVNDSKKDKTIKYEYNLVSLVFTLCFVKNIILIVSEIIKAHIGKYKLLIITYHPFLYFTLCDNILQVYFQKKIVQYYLKY